MAQEKLISLNLLSSFKDKLDENGYRPLYGTSDTAAGTAEKAVVLSDFAGYVAGIEVRVKFTNSNTASNPTLNVNNKGAKAIYRYGSTKPGTTEAESWKAGAIVSFTYDGTNFVMNDVQDVEDVDFEGTQSEWAALTTEQKKAYDHAFITDDYDAPDHMDADEVDFSNTGTSLVSTNVQSAIVEIANGLGTAASKDVASSGDASSTQVVMGNDSRLSDSRNAKDVYSWAKASSKPSYTASEVGAIATSTKGTANGVAELDANGLVPSSQLPSYVDDILEYSSLSEFPATGETGKIYVATDTNLTYRWSGSDYVEISPSLALGETSSTAYRGDRGKTAYDHATDSSRLTTAQTSGLYKIATTAEGHVASVSEVQKSDITALGIPESDTNTTYTLSAGSGDDAQKVILTPSSGNAQKVTVPYATNAGDASTVNGKTVAVNVPSDAVFTDTKDADNITYSNTTSGLSATNVQDAIDELKSDEDYSKYIGTSTDWELLSTEEKKKYDLAFFTND